MNHDTPDPAAHTPGPTSGSLPPPASGPPRTPPPTCAPESERAFAQALADAARAGERVLPVGLGTRPGPGALPPRVDRVISTAKLADVVAHDPADLTITVQAGLPLATLDELLARHDQWLPHQPYRGRGSVGGLVASGAEGALDLLHGRTRDDLIGVRVALADGTLARGKGRVVKNVAGYDSPRLLAGSLGTLAVVLEASFRLKPRPRDQACVVAGLQRPEQALEGARAVLDSGSRPSFVNLIGGGCGVQLVLGFDGSATRVTGEAERWVARLTERGALSPIVLRGERERELRRGLDDPFGTDPHAVLRWSGRPSRLGEALRLALLCLPGLRFDLRPGLGVGWFACVEPPSRAVLTELLEGLRASGQVVLMAGPDALRRDPRHVWGPAPPDFGLMSRLKTAFDPNDVLAPGRFVGGL